MQGMSINNNLYSEGAKTKLNNTNLDKAERQEGYIVSTEQGVEQHFLNSSVEVAFQLLHFCPN